MTQAAKQETERLARQAAKTRATRVLIKKTAFTVAGLLAFAAMWWSGAAFRIPLAYGFDAALLPTPGKLVIVLVVMALAGAVGGWIVGRFHYDGGVAVAAVALLAISARGGRLQDVLHLHQNPNIYLTMAVESAILFGGIFAVWLLLNALRRRAVIRDTFHSVADDCEPLGQRLLASGAHLLIMGALVTIACQSDDKLQVWVTLLLSGYIAARAAYAFVPADDGIYFWPVPLALSFIGYVAAYSGSDTSPTSPIMIGQVTGSLAGLARPLPVDWASAGVIGSIVGFWAARERKFETSITGPDRHSTTTDLSVDGGRIVLQPAAKP